MGISPNFANFYPKIDSSVCTFIMYPRVIKLLVMGLNTYIDLPTCDISNSIAEERASKTSTSVVTNVS